MDFSEDYRKSNCCSKLTYYWANRIISHAKKNKKIKEGSNLIAMPKSWDTDVISSKIDEKISEQKLKDPNTKAQKSIGTTLAKAFKKDIVLMLSMAVFSDCIGILNIFLISFFVGWLKDDDAEKWQGYLYAILLSALTLTASYARNIFLFYASSVGIAIRKGLGGIIFKKILRINQRSKSEATSGKLVTIVSGELQLIERSMIILPAVISSPITLVFACILLAFIFEEAAIFGFIVGVIILFVLYVLSSYIKKYKYNEGYYSDKRLKVLSDIINGIRTIKAYAWEKPFYNLVEKFRNKMITNFQKHEVAESCMWGIGITGGYFVGIAVFGYHYAMDREFNYEESIAGIGICSFASTIVFQQMFLGLNVYRALNAILGRVGEVLDLEESQFAGLEDDMGDMQEGTRIYFENASLTWGFSLRKEKEIANKIDQASNDVNLNQINFISKTGDFTAVVGEVGSGKSTFLSAVMKELVLLDGSLKINGKIAYVEQEPFIVSGTVKDNILFGDEFDQDKFDKVVEVCCLEHDLQIFNRGADTEIGERGINASGGQKARISLARAVYSDADIYLLDDPLSAVDPDVAGKLYNQCIEGYLKDKCVVLVTHQVQYLKNVENILVLDDGKIKMRGSYDELKDQGLDFDSILKNYEKDDK